MFKFLNFISKNMRQIGKNMDSSKNIMTPPVSFGCGILPKNTIGDITKSDFSKFHYQNGIYAMTQKNKQK